MCDTNANSTSLSWCKRRSLFLQQQQQQQQQQGQYNDKGPSSCDSNKAASRSPSRASTMDTEDYQSIYMTTTANERGLGYNQLIEHHNNGLNDRVVAGGWSNPASSSHHQQQQQQPRRMMTPLLPDEELSSMLESYLDHTSTNSSMSCSKTRPDSSESLYSYSIPPGVALNSAYQASPGQQSVDSGFSGDQNLSTSPFHSSSQHLSSTSTSSFDPHHQQVFHADDPAFYFDYDNSRAGDQVTNATGTTTDQDLSVIVDQVLDSIESQFTSPPLTDQGLASMPETPSDGCEGVLCHQCANVVSFGKSICDVCGQELPKETETVESSPSSLPLGNPNERSCYNGAELSKAATGKAVAVARPMPRTVGVVEPRVVVKIPLAKVSEEETDKDPALDLKEPPPKCHKHHHHKRHHKKHKHKRKHHSCSKKLKHSPVLTFTDTLPEHFRQKMAEIKSIKSCANLPPAELSRNKRKRSHSKSGSASHSQHERAGSSSCQGSKKAKTSMAEPGFEAQQLHRLKLVKANDQTGYKVQEAPSSTLVDLADEEEKDERLSSGSAQEIEDLLRKRMPLLNVSTVPRATTQSLKVRQSPHQISPSHSGSPGPSQEPPFVAKTHKDMTTDFGQLIQGENINQTLTQKCGASRAEANTRKGFLPLSSFTSSSSSTSDREGIQDDEGKSRGEGEGKDEEVGEAGSGGICNELYEKKGGRRRGKSLKTFLSSSAEDGGSCSSSSSSSNDSNAKSTSEALDVDKHGGLLLQVKLDEPHKNGIECQTSSALDSAKSSSAPANPIKESSSQGLGLSMPLLFGGDDDELSDILLDPLSHPSSNKGEEENQEEPDAQIVEERQSEIAVDVGTDGINETSPTQEGKGVTSVDNVPDNVAERVGNDVATLPPTPPTSTKTKDSDSDDEVTILTPPKRAVAVSSKPVKISTATEPDEKWLYCDKPHCDFSTRKPQRMERHMLSHPPGQSKCYKCPDCSETFTSLARMLRHDRKEHTGEKDYECKICEAEVTDIAVHMRVHKTEKDFKCDICSLEFRHKNSLVRHLVQHAGDRPFKCQFCEANFMSNAKLKEHTKKKHSDITNGHGKSGANHKRPLMPIAPAPLKNGQQLHQAHGHVTTTAFQPILPAQTLQAIQPMSFLAPGPNGTMFLVTNPSTFALNQMPLIINHTQASPFLSTPSILLQNNFATQSTTQPIFIQPPVGSPVLRSSVTPASSVISSVLSPRDAALLTATTPEMKTPEPSKEPLLDLPDKMQDAFEVTTKADHQSLVVETKTGQKVSYDILERAILEIPDLDQLTHSEVEVSARKKIQLPRTDDDHDEGNEAPSVIMNELEVDEEGDSGSSSMVGDNNNKDPLPFACDKCGRKYKFKNFLDVHQRRPCV